MTRLSRGRSERLILLDSELEATTNPPQIGSLIESGLLSIDNGGGIKGCMERLSEAFKVGPRGMSHRCGICGPRIIGYRLGMRQCTEILPALDLFLQSGYLARTP